MKKIICCLLIFACFAGVVFAQAAPNADNQERHQEEQGQGAERAADRARQKYAKDIKELGISKAVKKALQEGVLSVKDIVSVAVAQGVPPTNVLTSMSINGVNSNDIIAANVEGVTAEQVTTAYTAVAQFTADVANNADSAVKNAIEGGVLSLDNILEAAAGQGVNPTNMLTAMSNNGVPVNDVMAAAGIVGITSDTVEQIYNQTEPSDVQAYTPAEEGEGGPQGAGWPGERGQQPDSPSDRGQRPDTMPVNAATPAVPTFQLPVGPIGGGGNNGPPEDFTPASPSRPI